MALIFTTKKLTLDSTHIFPPFSSRIYDLQQQNIFNNQIEMIKSFMSWNGYPISIRNFLIRILITMPTLRLIKI